MAPPHTTAASQKAGKKSKPSKPTAAAVAPKHVLSDRREKTNKPKGVQKAAHRPAKPRDAVKHVAHTDDKVGKEKKVRQRGGRGRGRGRGRGKGTQTMQAVTRKDSPRSPETTATTSAVAKPSSHGRTLLTLPEEIRHEILTLVLKEQPVVDVSGLKLGVTRGAGWFYACRQLRAEGVRTWLHVNRFRLVVDRFDSLVPAAWKQFQVAHQQATKTILVVNDSYNWHKLLLCFQTGEHVVVPEIAMVTTPSHAVANAAIGIAQGMVGKPADELFDALEKVQLALEYFDDGWV